MLLVTELSFFKISLEIQAPVAKDNRNVKMIEIEIFSIKYWLIAVVLKAKSNSGILVSISNLMIGASLESAMG